MAVFSKVRALGNSKGVILPQTVLDQLEWSPDAEVEVRIEGKKLILIEHTKRVATDEEFGKAKNHVFKKHGNLLKGLAKR